VHEPPPVAIRSGNPYANIQVSDEPNFIAASPVKPVSKAEFRLRCRGIFERYIPFLENKKLRPHQRDFIVRNESRSALARGRILAELKRYDISNLPGLTPRFNRERDPFTETKLLAIERLAE